MSERFTDNDLDDAFRQSLDKMETEPSEGFWVKASENDLFLRNLAHVRQLRKWKIAAYSFAALFVSVAGYTAYTKLQLQGTSNNVALANVRPVTNTISDKMSNPVQGVPANSATTTQDVAQTNSTAPNPVTVNTVKGNVLTAHISSTVNLKLSTSFVQHNASAVLSNNVSPAVTEENSPQNFDSKSNVTDRKQEPVSFSLNELIAAHQISDPIEPICVSQTISPGTITEVTGPAIPVAKRNVLSKLSVSVFYQPYINDEMFEGDNMDEVPINNTINNEEENSPYQVGVRLGYDISRRVSVITGCYYYNFQVCVNPTTIVAQQNNDGVGYQFQTSLGNVTCPYEGKVRVGDILVVNGTAKANYISVPLLFKYVFTPNSRLRFYITAGGTTNFVANREMEVYWQDSKWEDGYDVEGIESKQKVYFSYYIAPGISYGLFKGFLLYAEPSLQGSPVLSGSNSRSNNSSFIGMGGGITYHF